MGVSGRESLQPVAPLASLHITNLVLSDNVAPAVCSKDPLDPLCMQDRRIEVPAQTRFPASTQLVVHFSVLGMKLDSEQAPALNVTFRLDRDGRLSAWEPDEVRAVRGYAPGALLVMARFTLQPLGRGSYTLEANAEDATARKTITERAHFTVQ